MYGKLHFMKAFSLNVMLSGFLFILPCTVNAHNYMQLTYKVHNSLNYDIKAIRKHSKCLSEAAETFVIPAKSTYDLVYKVKSDPAWTHCVDSTGSNWAHAWWHLFKVTANNDRYYLGALKTTSKTWHSMESGSDTVLQLNYIGCDWVEGPSDDESLKISATCKDQHNRSGLATRALDINLKSEDSKDPDSTNE